MTREAANAAFLLVLAGAAVASTLLAARRTAGVERIFWCLLAAAALAAGLAQGREAGAYLPSVLVMAALLMRPHRAQSLPVPLAALDGVLVASCAAFLIAYGLRVPHPHAARVLHLAADALPLLHALLLAWTARDKSYQRVYALLSVGFAGRLALGGAASWAPLVFLAVAALRPAEAVWIARTRGDRAEASVGRLAILLVALPPLVDAVARGLGATAGAAERSRLAMAATVVLALLASVRVRLSLAAARVEPSPSPVPGDEESARFLAFAAGVAHQVNNRLNVVSGWCQVAKRKGEGDCAALDELMAAVREASDAAAQFQRLAAMRREARPR